MTQQTTLTRCAWVNDDPLYLAYHDTEWGRPVHDDRHLFEMLILEGAQAGLSWITVLRKRESYRAAFDDFDAGKIAHYDDAKLHDLLQNPGIIRNKLKVNAAVTNARAFLELQAEFGSFDAFIWRFVGHQPIINHWRSLAEVPTETAEARAMSAALKQRGFKFIGPTICYAFMQACGMVDDHTTDCFRYAERE